MYDSLVYDATKWPNTGSVTSVLVLYEDTSSRLLISKSRRIYRALKDDAIVVTVMTAGARSDYTTSFD